MIIETLPFRRHAIALILAAATGSAHAGTINVNNSCSLVDAITSANTDQATGGCAAGNGADSINLVANKTYILTTVNNNSDGPNGLPSVTSFITINGNGAAVVRSGNESFRLIHVAATGNLSLNNIKLKNGQIDQSPYLGGGGGIFNAGGQLALTNSAITDNSANGYFSCGGGIYTTIGSVTTLNDGSIVSGNEAQLGAGICNKGSIKLKKSAVINNAASGMGYYGGEGGGIWNKSELTLIESIVSGNSAAPPFIVGYSGGTGGGITSSGTLVADKSVISNNKAYKGGGIVSNGGRSTLINDTLSGNKALSFCDVDLSCSSGTGGGILTNSGTMFLTHTTVSGSLGGGIFNNGGSLKLTNSLIANSEKGGDCFSAAGAILQLQGVNLIEDGSCGAPLSGDPKLGFLLDNGGFTPTHALAAASPAVNKADSTKCLFTDQRSVKRPQPAGSQCDIGAFERIPVSQSVLDTVHFFNTQIASGGIIGVGTQPLADQRRSAALYQLISAGNYRDQALKSKACTQLAHLLTRIDPDNTPDHNDYVTGSETDTLAEKITALRIKWVCS